MEFEYNYSLVLHSCVEGHKDFLPINLKYRQLGAISWNYANLVINCRICHKPMKAIEYGSHEDTGASYNYLPLSKDVKEIYDKKILGLLEKSATPEFMLKRIEQLEEENRKRTEQIANLQLCGCNHDL